MNLKQIFCFSLILSSIIVQAFKIALPDNPTLPEKTAADELKTYLTKSLTNGIFLNKSEEEITFHVGNTGFARKHGIDVEAMLPGQFVFCSKGNKDIILAGASSRGTLYAVYAFLEEKIGIRWYTPQNERIPHYKQKLLLKAFNQKITLPFALREIYPSNHLIFRDQGQFAVRSFLNAYGKHGISAEYGGSVRFGGKDFCHTFDAYFPEKEFMKKHPEYFSLVNNKRIGGQRTGQLCLSNQEVTRLMIEKIRNEILKDEKKAAATGVPAPQLYDISQNDNPAFCSCPACQKIVREEGGFSGPVIRFVNKVAAEIKKFRPELKITTLAYGKTENPPKLTKVADNVIVRLTNTAGNRVGSILAPEQTPHRERLQKWASIGAGIYIWEYPTFYGLATLPYPSEFFYEDMFDFYSKSNVKMIFFDYSIPPRDDMGEMKFFLLAKFLKDPNGSRKKWMQDFLNGYYGSAGKLIMDYRKLLYDSVQKHHSMVFNSPESFTFLDLTTVLKAFQILDEAEKTVKESPKLLGRVRRCRFNLNQAAFVRFRQLSSEWIDAGKTIETFPFRQDKLLADIEQEWSLIESKILPSLRPVHKKNWQKFKKRYAIFPDTIKKPTTFKNWKQGTIDLTVDLANVWVPIVKDADSTIGFAAFADFSKPNAPKGAVPLIYGSYNFMSGKSLPVSGVIKPNADSPNSYHYYYCGKIKPGFACCIYFLKNWFIQFPLDSAMAKYPDREFDIYISAKFAGKSYSEQAPDKPYGIFVDRCLLVPRSKTGGK